MNTKKRAIKSAIAVTVAVAVLAPTAASATVTGWLHGVADTEKPSGCPVEGYDASNRAVVYELTSCSGTVGVKGRYSSGGYNYETSWDYDPQIATVNHSNINAFKMSL